MPLLVVALLCPECERAEVVDDLREFAFFAIPPPVEEEAIAAMLGDFLLWLGEAVFEAAWDLLGLALADVLDLELADFFRELADLETLGDVELAERAITFLFGLEDAAAFARAELVALRAVFFLVVFLACAFRSITNPFVSSCCLALAQYKHADSSHMRFNFVMCEETTSLESYK